MTRRPALLEDGQLSACAHDWLGLSANAAHWLRLAPPVWCCTRCGAHTRLSELVGPLTFTQVTA